MTVHRTVRFAASLLALTLALVLWAPAASAGSTGAGWLQSDAQATPGDDLSGASPCLGAASGAGACCHRPASAQAAAGTTTQAEKQPPAALPAVVAVAPPSPAAPLPVVRLVVAGPPLFLLFPRLRI